MSCRYSGEGRTVDTSQVEIKVLQCSGHETSAFKGIHPVLLKTCRFIMTVPNTKIFL